MVSQNKSKVDFFEEAFESLSKEDILKLVPWEFIELVAKGFYAGIVGPKAYSPNSWLNMGLNSTLDVLPSFLGHIAHSHG